MTNEEFDQRMNRLAERQEALAESVQLLTHGIHEMQTQQKRLDARERKAREALLSGIAAYLRALQNGDEPEEAVEG